MDVLAAALGTLDVGFLDVGDVVALREFLIAVGAVKRILGHSGSPRQHHSADGRRWL